MATPIILSSGTFSGAGVAGEGRNDLSIGETVGLSDTEVINVGASYVWAFQDVPIGSTTVMINATTATPNFVPDITGSYRLICTVDGTDTAVEVLAVPLPLSAGRIPSFSEELEYDEGGNVKGWHYSMSLWMRSVDVQLALSGSLDQAYNTGSNITADAGAVTITNPNADAANVLELITTTLGTGAALRITNTGDGPAISISNGQVLIAASSSNSAPALSFAGETNTGLYRSSFGTLTIVSLGAQAAHFVQNTIRVSSISGSAATLQITSQGDTNTGHFWAGSDVIGIATGGVEAVRWTTGQDQINAGDITAGGQVFAPPGTGAAPGFSFTGAAGFGITRDGTGLITYLVASGQSIIGAAAAGVTISKNTTIAGSINASLTDTWNIGSTGTYYASVNTKNLSMREQATSPSSAASAGYLWVKTDVPNELWFTDDVGAEWQLSGLGADGSTLDASYDYAGAGSGRAITADAGAVTITNPNADAATVLELTTTALATGAALSITNVGDGAAISISNGPILGPDGSNAANSYSFTSSPNSGLFHGGAHRIVIGSNSTSAAHFVANQIRTSSIAGSESTLQLASQGDTDTGHFWGLLDVLGVATGGTEAVRWDINQDQTNAGRIFASSGAIGANTGYSFSSSSITGMGYDGTLIRFMYHGSGRLELDSLGGGFTKTGIAAGVSLTPAFTVDNISAATAGVPVQNSAGWGLKGNVWDTTTVANRVVHHSMQMIATSGITADVRADLVFSAVDTGVSIETGRLTSKGQWLMPLGSAAAPPFSFLGFEDMGPYKGAGNTLAWAVQGVQRMTLINSQLKVIQPGTEGTPAFGVGNSTVAGLWEPGTNDLAISTDGVEAIRWDTSQNTIIPQGSRFVFDDDLDSYIVAAADDNLAIVTGGATRMTVANSVISCAPAFSVNTGNAAAPGLRNNGDADSGLFFDVVGEMGATASGLERQRWTSNGTGIPVSTITRNSVVAVSAGETIGLLLENNTLAASEAPQYSPMSALSSQGWKSSATASSQEVIFAQQLRTQQGVANPTANLLFLASIENVSAGAYQNVLSMQHDGVDASVFFYGEATPIADSAHDLGRTGTRWANLFVDEVVATTDITAGGDLDAEGGFRRTVGPNRFTADGTSTGTLTSDGLFVDALGWFVFARPGSVVELAAWAEGDITAGSIEFFIEKSTDGGDSFSALWGTSGTGAVSMSSGGSDEVSSNTVAKDTNVFAKDDVLRIRAAGTGYTGGVRVFDAHSRVLT